MPGQRRRSLSGTCLCRHDAEGGGATVKSLDMCQSVLAPLIFFMRAAFVCMRHAYTGACACAYACVLEYLCVRSIGRVQVPAGVCGTQVQKEMIPPQVDSV